MENLEEFEYNGNIISFTLTGNDVMINATEMVKLFPGKRIAEWKRLPSTQEYLRSMFEVGFSHIKDYSDIIISERGSELGKSRGGGCTWMHRLVAIEFARGLSPIFSIWCNMKIDEIINNGFALRDTEIGRLNSIINAQQSQVDYYNQILTTSNTVYTTRDIVKGLNLKVSNIELLSLLENNGFIFRTSDRKKWYLRNPFDKFGYTKILPIITTDKTGKQSVRNRQVWTEGGKYWIWSLALKWNII